MRVHRGYVVALCLAVAAAAASFLSPSRNGEDPELKAQQAALALARQHLPQAMTALERLKVPGDFRRLTTGCHWYRCYVVAKPTPQVAPTLPGILRSVGAVNPQSRHLQEMMEKLNAGVEQATLPAFRSSHINPPKVVGCNTSYNSREGVSLLCAYPAVIQDNAISFSLGPYFACPPSPCRWTNESEVSISFPSGSRQAATQ